MFCYQSPQMQRGVGMKQWQECPPHTAVAQFNSHTWCQMWVKFVVGSCPCSKGFSLNWTPSCCTLHRHFWCLSPLSSHPPPFPSPLPFIPPSLPIPPHFPSPSLPIPYKHPFSTRSLWSHTFFPSGWLMFHMNGPATVLLKKFRLCFPVCQVRVSGKVS